MVEWWQTLLIAGSTAAITGVVAVASGLIAARFQHKWTTEAAQEAEQRQAQHMAEAEQRSTERKIEEERRQARRVHRRERLQDVIDCLDKVKVYHATQANIASTKSAWSDNLAGAKDKITWEAWEASLRKRYPAPSHMEMTQAFYVAMASIDSSMVPVLQELVSSLLPESEENKPGRLLLALRAAERAVEESIVGT